MRVALCPHISLDHYRGGEKWTVELANRLAADGVDVAVRALPYTPGNERRVSAVDLLDHAVDYRESWRHDLSRFDTAYLFYNPFSSAFFGGDVARVAGIHSWVYVAEAVFESHYGLVPTAVKLLYRLVGRRELRRFDAVHTVTPAFDAPGANTVYIPNFVDADRFRPGRAPLSDTFTVLVTAAHIPQKGWDVVREVAAGLPEGVCLAATGQSDDPNVHDLGFLDEDQLADAYARAHVVVHPARVDTDSMVINEACASGTPVITTPIPTHVRENAAIIHADSTAAVLDAVERVRGEWRRTDGYDRRCRVAREEGERHGVDVVYPRLKRLLSEPDGRAP